MVNINNSTFFYFPHIIAFYIQRNLETETATESSGLASCKHQTMSIHSLTKAMARHSNLAMLHTQPYISFIFLSIINQNKDMCLLLDYFSIGGEGTEKKKGRGRKHNQNTPISPGCHAASCVDRTTTGNKQQDSGTT